MTHRFKTSFSLGSLVISAVCASLLLAGYAPTSGASEKRIGYDWPQWRGLNRDGLSLEAIPAGSLSETGPQIDWKIPIGEGYSGVSLADGRLYTMWQEGGFQYLVCLDQTDGKEIWRLEVGASFRDGYGNGPRTSPVVEKNAVFSISADAHLFAVQVSDGKVIWSHDLPAEFGGRIPDHGYSSSPLIEGEKLLVEVGGKEGYSFVAFDKNNGDVIWHVETDEPSYSSPIAITLDKTRQVVFLSAAGLFSVSPENGTLYWTYDWEARCPATKQPTNTSTPVFIPPDKIFISGGYGTITGAAVVQVNRQGGKFIVRELWKSEAMSNVINSSLYYENYIYGFDNNKLTCLNPLTGEEMWNARGYQKGSLIASKGHLIVLSERGKLALVDPDPEKFNEIASIQIMDGTTWTIPSLAHGKLYLRSHSEMICLDLLARSER